MAGPHEGEGSSLTDPIEECFVYLLRRRNTLPHGFVTPTDDRASEEEDDKTALTRCAAVETARLRRSSASIWQPMSPEQHVLPLHRHCLGEYEPTGRILLRRRRYMCERADSAAHYPSGQGALSFGGVGRLVVHARIPGRSGKQPVAQHAVAGLPAVQFNVMVSSFRCAGRDDQTGPPTTLGPGVHCSSPPPPEGCVRPVSWPFPLSYRPQ